MRPTLFGVRAAVFYIVMLAAFYATHYSNLFFLLLAFLTLLGLAGVRAAWRNVRGVTARLADCAPVPSCGGVALPIELHAAGAPRFQLEARVRVAGQWLAGEVDLLDGDGRVHLPLPALARGVHAIERATLESAHPFGLVRARRAFDAPRELVVYPAPLDLQAGRSAAQALDDLLGRGDPGGGDLQPASLRDHRDGDELRGVHWRASARRGRLVVQEWEGGSGQGLEVVLDRRCAEEELEEALATISAMVHLARTNKETLRLHSQDLSETYGAGHAPWAAALRFLACAQPVPQGGAAPPATSPSVARLPRSAVHA